MCRLLWYLSHGYYKMNRLVCQCQSFLVDWIMKSLEWISKCLHLLRVSRIFQFSSLTSYGSMHQTIFKCIAKKKQPWTDNDLFNLRKKCIHADDTKGRKRFLLIKSIKNRYDDKKKERLIKNVSYKRKDNLCKEIYSKKDNA